MASVGGFYRTTHGVRDAGFPADEGRSISSFPGFAPLKGTLMSNERRRFTVEAAPGKTLTYDLGDDNSLKLYGTNLNNAVDLTEGNSRLTGASFGPINARPLFGRAIEAALL